MREIIKFKYYYSNWEKTFSRVFDMDKDIANGSHWDEISDSQLLKEYKIVGRGQYTELKDKNSEETFEWDIVKIPDDWENYWFMAWEVREVCFKEGMYRYKPKDSKKGKGSYLEEWDYEIIWNIYENPELLDNN